MILLYLYACVGPPAGIPDQAGTIDADSLAELASISGPDVPFLIWLTAEQVVTQDWRDCPSIYVREDGVNLRGNGCADATDVTWQGSMSTFVDGSRMTITLHDFGAEATGVDGWTADGTVAVEATDSDAGYRIDTDLTLTSLQDGDPKLYWVHTYATIGQFDQVWYADRYNGDVGIEGWGTAVLDSTNLPLAAPYGCDWGAYAAGEAWFGDSARLTYTSLDLLPVTFGGADTGGADTGTSDTGGGNDSGYHNDSGYNDSGYHDSGDSAGGDSGPIDTGGSGESGGDLGAPSFGEGVCGTCIEAAVDSTNLEGCLEPTRNFDWPFPAPF